MKQTIDLVSALGARGITLSNVKDRVVAVPASRVRPEERVEVDRRQRHLRLWTTNPEYREQQAISAFKRLDMWTARISGITHVFVRSDQNGPLARLVLEILALDRLPLILADGDGLPFRYRNRRVRRLPRRPEAA